MRAQDHQSKIIEECMIKLTKKPIYQYLSIILMCFYWLQITYGAMIGSYVFMNPQFICNGKSATQVEACNDMRHCVLVDKFTATYDDGLYCQRKIDRANIQAMFAFGALVGMYGLTAVADVLGRRAAINISLLIQFIAGCALISGIYINIIFLMMFGHFLSGVFASGLTIISFVYSGEICGNKMRQIGIMMYCSTWGLAQMSYYLFYNYFPFWYQHLIWIVFVPSIILMIISFYFVVESPYYCIVKQKNCQKFNKVVDVMSRYNDIPLQIVEEVKQTISKLNSQTQQQNKNKSLSLKQILIKILTTKQYFLTYICLSLNKFAYNIFYYGIQGSLERVGYNFGLTMLIVGLNQFIACLIFSLFVPKIKRKIGLMISIIITSLIGLLFLLKIVEENNILQSVIIALTRIGSTCCYSLISLLTVQIFPIDIKSTAVGLTVGTSQVGRIILPYMITVVNDFGIHQIIVSSVLYIGIGVLPLIPIKQTLVSGGKLNEKLLGDHGGSIQSDDCLVK